VALLREPPKCPWSEQSGICLQRWLESMVGHEIWQHAIDLDELVRAFDGDEHA
jgi:hypothetical protein